MQNQTAAARAAETPGPADGVNFTNRVLGAILCFLAVAVYAPTILWTARIIVSSDDMAHGLCAPFVAGYLVYQRRGEIFGKLGAPSAWGLALLIAAAIFGVAGALSDSATVLRFAFLATLSACIALAGGTATLVRVRFPLLLLLFTFPIPPVLYAQITAPLQSLATNLSQSALQLIGFTVLREGNLLELPHYRLSIVEACSGIRSLVTLVFFCCLYAYLLEKKFWRRVAIVLLSIPSALILNVLRIAITGILGEWRPELTQGVYHETLGWVCLGLGFVLVLLLYRGAQFTARFMTGILRGGAIA